MAARKAADLHVVKPDEAPDAKPEEKPKGVIEAAAKGTHRELLVAMRDRIARAVADPKCPPRDLAALTRRLHEIAKEIEVIDLTDDPEVAGNGADVDDEEFNSSDI